MFGLPKTTEFNKKIPKQKFYEKLDITPALKRVFVEQIKAIYWTNKIAASTVNLAVGKSVTELEVFKIELTSQSLDLSALHLIDKAIPYHIIFALCYNDRYQLVSSYKATTHLDAPPKRKLLGELSSDSETEGVLFKETNKDPFRQPSAATSPAVRGGSSLRYAPRSCGAASYSKILPKSTIGGGVTYVTEGAAHEVSGEGVLKKSQNLSSKSFFSTDWLPEPELQLPLIGLDLDSVYEAILRYIAGDELKAKEGTHESLKQSVERAEQRQKLMKQIDKLQKKVNREVQFSIQVELNAQLKKLKCELEALL